MRKIIYYFKVGVLLIGLQLLTINCNNDETISMQEENLLESKFKIPSVSIAQNSFELSTQIRDPFKSASSSSSELFRTNSESENEIFVNWDKSVAKKFKEEDGGVDILYTPVEYNSHNVRMKTFVASVENESELESSIITVVYDDTSNKYQFSGLIIKHYLNGDLKQIYRYENGIRVLESVEYDSYIENNQSETASIAIGDALFTEYPEADTDCDMTIGELLLMIWESGGGYFAFDEVVVVASGNVTGNDGSGGTGDGWDGDGFDWENPDDILNQDGGGGSPVGGNEDDENGDNTNESGDEEEPEWWEDCGEGYVLDADGNCVEIIPCAGNPLPKIKLAHQLGLSGWKGGMFGNSNIGGCTRFGANHCSTPRNKKHEGLDLESSYGDPIYAMYDGVATKITQHDKDGVTVIGAGHYVSITSTVNGEEIKILYFHMQEDNRKSGDVSVGDIIGFQGDSGNLKGAIDGGYAISHLHIKIKDSYGNAIDPRPFLSTEMDINGNVTQNENCN